MDAHGKFATSPSRRASRRIPAIVGVIIASTLGLAEPAFATSSVMIASNQHAAMTATTATTTSSAVTSHTASGTSTTTVAAPSAATAAPTTSAGSTTSAATASSVTQPAAAPGTSRILNVPLYMQTLALSCEEAALRMALASEGIQATDSQLLAIIGIDPRSAYVDASGLRWGNPYTSFVGDPSGSQTSLTGYGTYYPTVARAATSLGGHVIATGEGISPSQVYAAILAGHPVVAWVTYQWVPAQRSDYVAFDGTVVPYAGPVEHAVTVVGVTPTQVYINNPDDGVEIIPKAVFESSYATYNNMAVILK
jgi:uncharacterized protein YvpB